jgi:predicted DNA binding CopG/RHH family protein
MWLYVTLMLKAFLENRPTNDRKISFNEFADFVFIELFGNRGIIFHDTRRDLEIDVKILSNLGVISYNEEEKQIFIDEEQWRLLEAIVEGIEKDESRKEIRLLNEYIERIKKPVS